jgi:iron-sulfur cluster assembly protein
MLTITDRAAGKISEFLGSAEEEADGLRVRVTGGGCSGLQYKIELSAERKGDKVFEHGQARLYIDRKSYLYLNGTEVDYKDGLQGAGFDLRNPNVKRTCGCGESFIV